MADKDFKVKNKLFVNGLSQTSGVILATNNNLDSHTNLPTQYGGTGTTTSPSAGQFLYSSDGTTYAPTNLSSYIPSAATPTSLGTIYGYSSTSEYSNIAIGYSALAGRSTFNDEQIAIGFQSLNNVTSAAYGNVMVGYKSGTGISSGYKNIGIGGWNFWGTATGISNIAIGYETLPAYNAGGLTGNNNIFIGHGAGYDSKSSITDNVAIGNSALYYADNAYSTAVGSGTLSNVTTGNSNTAIGYNAGYSLTTGANNIIIGANSAASSVNVSNEITIGDSNINKFRIPGLGIDWNKNIEIMSYMGAI